ncbi:unnamed protein product [Chondrus crispus]|uniref:Uncharacterized protein n=1 Tax=Chondrus crispus TaxID=2769 RepID=R7Q8U6_CHOCR|nr:unnamed protein product [Chondrus crispus]CDF33895.1 unnamed protein product [Chondrus crispus]|eukprot:XP_005713714.1 unnamed protein product [Chondrus crispus]
MNISPLRISLFHSVQSEQLLHDVDQVA